MAKARKKKLDRPWLRNRMAEALGQLDNLLTRLETAQEQDLLTSDGDQLLYLVTEARRQLGTAKVMYLESDVVLGWTREA